MPKKVVWGTLFGFKKTKLKGSWPTAYNFCMCTSKTNQTFSEGSEYLLTRRLDVQGLLHGMNPLGQGPERPKALELGFLKAQKSAPNQQNPWQLAGFPCKKTCFRRG